MVDQCSTCFFVRQKGSNLSCQVDPPQAWRQVDPTDWCGHHSLDGVNASIALQPVVNVNADNTQWTTFGMVVATTVGNFGGTAITGRYKAIGKTVIFSASLHISSVGSASGVLSMGFPLPPRGDAMLFGTRDSGIVVPLLVYSLYDGLNYGVYLQDFTFPGISGCTIATQGVYETP